MKIKVFGFELSPAEGVGIQQFFNFLQSKNGQTIDDRILAVTSHGDWWFGVVLSIKDAKAFCKIRREGGRFHVGPEGLGDGRIVDFNYFVIYQPTGRGLYQHYFHSARINTFATILSKHYKELCKTIFNEESEGVYGRERSALENRYSGFLGYQVLCRRETLEQKVRQLARIKSIQFEYGSLVVPESDPLTPLLPYAKKRNERITFRNSNFGTVKEGVLEFIHRFGEGKLQVAGIDPAGHEQVYKLMNDHDTFEEFDYDTILETIDIDSARLADAVRTSPMLQKIYQVAHGSANALLTMPTR